MYSGNTDIFWETLSEYSRLRRKYCDSFYGLPSPLEESPEYHDFVSTAELISRVGAKTSDFMGVLFQGADMYHFPEPKDLHTSIAEKRWRLLMINQRIKEHVGQQAIYVHKCEDLGIGTQQEAVLLGIMPFASWYRLLHLYHPSRETIEEGLEEIRNPQLLDEITRRGYDVKKILHWRKTIGI